MPQPKVSRAASSWSSTRRRSSVADLGRWGRDLMFEDVEFDLTRLDTGKICSLA